MSDRLAVVMPVYNEQESISAVLDEWMTELNQMNIDFKILAFDDGSQDETLKILKEFESKNPNQVAVFHHSNKGHGQSCIMAYKKAIDDSYDFILQIDSDGQCDPKYFQDFWQSRSLSPVLGYRVSRDDGNARWWISRVVSIVGFLGTGTWVKDANVPYRLVQRDQLKQVIQNIPLDFHLANILVSLKLRQLNLIKWVPIHFRDRHGGSPSIKSFNFAQQGFKLLKQLWMS